MRRCPIALVSVAVLAFGLVACSDDKSTDATNTPTTSVASTTASTTEPTTESTTAESTPDSTTAAPTTVPAPAFPDRPYEVFVPSGYDADTAAPLVILLHGYGATGTIQELYFGLQPQAEARGFLYVHPDGTPNSLGSLAWSATDACCSDKVVDDAAYITSIIDEVSAGYNVDPARVFLVGHSNGGFMSYRMACEYADRIAAIVSLAGATFLDESQCAPSEPVNVLQIHGTADGTIKYGGGSTPLGTYPSAEATATAWSTYNGCAATTEPIGEIDLAYNVDGVETTQEGFTACPSDGDVELWTMAGGPHIPGFHPTFAETIIDWLFDHPNA